MSIAEAPDPRLVHSLYRVGTKTQVVRIALRLDVFSPLANGPAGAQAVADACACSAAGITLLLEYLCRLGLLTNTDGQYALSPTAAAFFVPGRRSYVGGWVLEQTNPDLFQDVLHSCRTGAPFRRAVPWEQLAWLESYDASRIVDSRKLWEAAGVRPGQHQALRVLDLACGCAITTLSLAQSHPTVHVTCVDSPAVLAAAEDLAGRLGVQGRTAFVPGNVHEVELEPDSYDVVLLENATNFYTVQQNQALFGRTWRALTPGGVLVINVTMQPGDRDEHIGLYSFILWTFTGTEHYSFDEYRGWLKQASFSRVLHLGKLWLSAWK